MHWVAQWPAPTLSARECENPDMRAPVSPSAAVLQGAFLEDLPDLREQLLRGEKLPEVTGKSAQWQSTAVPAVTTRTSHCAMGLDYAAHVRRGSAGSTRWPCSQAGCFRNSFLLFEFLSSCLSNAAREAFHTEPITR